MDIGRTSIVSLKIRLLSSDQISNVRYTHSPRVWFYNGTRITIERLACVTTIPIEAYGGLLIAARLFQGAIDRGIQYRIGRAEKQAIHKPYQPSSVYIIRNQHGHYKIGISIDIPDRIKNLGNAGGHALELLYKEKSDAAQTREQELHRTFAEYRTIGEWFAIPHDHPKLLKLLASPPTPTTAGAGGAA